MLTSTPTNHGAGITFYGDYFDLSAIHETVHKVAGQSWVEQRAGDYMLGLAFEIRKAIEGQREKRNFGIGSLDKVTYRGCSILWPVIITQVSMIRYFAAYRTTDHKDQACLFLLEDCIITSLLAFDAKVGKTCAELLLRFRPLPNNYLFSFTTEACRHYLFDFSEKKRFQHLPEVLGMLDSWSPEYKAYAAQIEKAATQHGCKPHEIETDAEWPKFKW